MDNYIDILFVDDQWCRPSKQKIFIAAYGSLQYADVPYKFYYETAEDGYGGYAAEPVLRKIKSIPDLKAIILDIMFGEEGDRLGLEILKVIREKYPILPVLIMTSVEKDSEVVVKAMEYGANEYLIKKPSLQEMETALRTYTQPGSRDANFAIWGNSMQIREVRALIARVALGSSASVLVTGESGTGKELVARAIHSKGPRKENPFIDKNCAYEDSTLLDDDLFGHEKGAFTDAIRQHAGRIERANGGILFLDEIGSMPLELQGKLLRVLENGEFQRLGGSENIKSDFQLICATNEEIKEKIEKKEFRNDFFQRVNMIEIRVPPLRERLEDIPILIELFIRQFREGTGASYRAKRISPEAVESMMSYDWPGNVRELKNTIERVMILSPNTVVGADELPANIVKNKVKKKDGGVNKSESVLDPDPENWGFQRLKREIEFAIEVKKRVREYKGKQWKTEFVHRLYPAIVSPSGKYFNDLIKRLTSRPWGNPNYEKIQELKSLIDELKK
jgi:DNA-binding NtrC family response regulator